MDDLIASRRKDWKNRISEKVSASNSISGALHGFLEEYLFYSKDEKELEKRLAKIEEVAVRVVKRFKDRRKDV
jgi:lantibiotic modifying enzyme